MADRPEPSWKNAVHAYLREPNAAGWIAFMILVVIIGFLSLYPNPDDSHPAKVPMANQAGH
jgi:hypothetical protein